MTDEVAAICTHRLYLCTADATHLAGLDHAIAGTLCLDDVIRERHPIGGCRAGRDGLAYRQRKNASRFTQNFLAAPEPSCQEGIPRLRIALHVGALLLGAGLE